MNILTAHLLNNVIAVFMLAPLVILYWRGGFMILQIYNTFHTYKYLAAFLEIAAGIAGGLMFSYTQVWMGKTSNRIRSPVAQLIIRRWYSYFFAWCVVCEWKGVWRLWDVVDAISGWETALYSLLVGLVPLLLTRCFRNTLAPPLATVSDLTETFFLIPTRFRTKRTSRIAHFLDNIFSMGIVIPLITSTWRGVWYLLDWLIVFPADVVAPERQLFWSYMISTLSGFAIAVIAVLLQKPSSVISAYLEQQGRWLSKIVFEDILMAVATFASIDLWRGVWGLYDEYFFPWDIVTSAWLSHIFGFFGLALMFHSNSAVMKGFQYDGEHSDGAGCWFPAKCLSVFDHFIQPSSDDPGGEGTDSNDSGNNQRSSAASLTQAMATQPVITVDDLAHGDPCETAKLRPLRRSHNSLHRLPSNSDINGLNADDVAWADPDELRKLRRTTFRSHYPHPDLSLMRKTSLISDRLSRADRLHTPITPIDSLVGHTNQNTQIS